MLIEGDGLHSHLYADDTQIYGFCRPSDPARLQSRLSSCVSRVASWMRANRLQLNTAKTGNLVFVSTPSTSDSRLAICRQGRRRFTSPLRSKPWNLLGLGRIHADSCCQDSVGLLLSSSSDPQHPSIVFQASPVVSRGVDGPGQAGLWQRDTRGHTLSAARETSACAKWCCTICVFGSKVYMIIRDLHWLPFPERITFRLAMLAYRCQHGLAP